MEGGGGQRVREGEIGLTTYGDSLAVSAAAEGARFLLVAGAPLNEAISWRGPVVMNTDEEIEEAWRELRNGTFIKEK